MNVPTDRMKLWEQAYDYADTAELPWPSRIADAIVAYADKPEGNLIKVVGEPLREWEPGRWWRLHGSDGKLKAESSSESEVRGFMEEGDTLYRSFEYRDKEFREVAD